MPFIFFPFLLLITFTVHKIVIIYLYHVNVVSLLLDIISAGPSIVKISNWKCTSSEVVEG